MGISRLGGSHSGTGSGRKRSNRISGSYNIVESQSVSGPASLHISSPYTGPNGEIYKGYRIDTTLTIAVGESTAIPASISYGKLDGYRKIGRTLAVGGLDILIQGGGGGGGAWVAGGGGGGGTVVVPNYTATPGNHTMSVGGGGGGNNNPGGMPGDMGGQRGGDTTAFGYIAKGGGVGSSWSSTNRNDGGNGGGGSSSGPVGPTTQTPQNGSFPGPSFQQYGHPGNSNGNPTSHGSAGGGGSGESPHNNNQAARHGNDGLLNTFYDGTNDHYGAGGGQGTHDGGYGNTTGGLGGGGTGYSDTQSNPGANGTGYGSGGGGCGRTGGQPSVGGSGSGGVVIIRTRIG